MRLTLPISVPFDLRLALHGHGWIGLPPHDWHDERREFTTALTLDGVATDVQVRANDSGLTVELAARSTLSRAAGQRARDALTSMLRLDEDLRPFWQLCRREPSHSWVARRGAGRLLRSANLFDDLMKLLFTTNCSWAATEKMTQRLVEALGEPTPSGRRAFPSATVCADGGEQLFRDTVRAGYRARSCASLSRAFANGDLTDELFTDPDLPTDELRRRLLALPGFGPYAAGQAMRLLGRHDDLALDSWCRARLCEILGTRKAPADRTVARRYAKFGRYRGLALWMELTADWHRRGRVQSPSS